MERTHHGVSRRLTSVLGQSRSRHKAKQSALPEESALTVASTAGDTMKNFAKLGRHVATAGALGDDTAGGLGVPCVLNLFHRRGVDVSQTVVLGSPPTVITMPPLRLNGEHPALQPAGPSTIMILDFVGKSTSEKFNVLHSSGPNALNELAGPTIANRVGGARAADVTTGLDLLFPGTLQSVEAFGPDLKRTDYSLSNAHELLGLTGSHDIAYSTSKFGRIRGWLGCVGRSLLRTSNVRRFVRVISTSAQSTGFSFAQQSKHCHSGDWAQPTLYEFTGAPSRNFAIGVDQSTRNGHSNKLKRILECICEEQIPSLVRSLANQRGDNGQSAPPGQPGVRLGKKLLTWILRRQSRLEIRSACKNAITLCPLASPGFFEPRIVSNWDLGSYLVSAVSKR